MHNITWHIVIGPVYGSIAVRNTSIQPSSVLKFKSHIIVLYLENFWFSKIYFLSAIHQYIMPISIAVGRPMALFSIGKQQLKTMQSAGRLQYL